MGGLREAHVHLAEYGAERSALDLSDGRSVAECLERIAKAADQMASAPRAADGAAHSDWIIAVRARAEGWSERRWPTAQELHDAARGRPCVVKSFDFHSLAASASALTAAGIDPDAAVPDSLPREFIECDERGRPTGFLLESAAQRVLNAAPAITHEQRVEHVRRACADLASRGFVEAHDMLSRPWLASILARLDDADELPLHVRLHPIREDFDTIAAMRGEFERERIKLGGLKVFTDGTLNSRTAWMLHPYSEPRADSPCGRRMMTDEEFVAALEQAASANVPIVAHAIGDAAVRWCLDLIAARGRRDLAHRIEHCEFVDESDVPRFAAFGVIASVQPCHLLADVEALRRFTPHRLHRVLPLRELYDAAASSGRNPADAIWFGSDAPVVAPEPRDNIQAAAERRRMGAPRSEAIAPEQAITIEELGALQQSFVPG